MIQINIPKAKEITHNIRREARAEEFAPLDFQINISIGNPTTVTKIETERQAIRDKYATIQTNIDNCSTADELKAIISRIKG